MKPPQHIDLDALDNARLLDLLRKDRDIECPEATRQRAREILESRGFDGVLIRHVSSLREDPRGPARKHYQEFKRHSTHAFLAYGVFLGFILASSLMEPNWMVSLLLLGLFGSLVGFIVLSLISQSHFYRALGRPFRDGSPLVFFFLGMPLYFLMYFHFKKEMELRLQNLP